MAAPRRDTRDKMIRAAVRLFQRCGFVGTALRDVIDDSGTPHGSVYFHFPDGKGELGAEAVSLWRALTVRSVERCAARAADAAELIVLVVEDFTRSLERSGFVEGCPVAVTALEMAPASEMLRVACDDMFVGWQDALRTHLTAAGVGQERACELAGLTVSVIEGALILSRTSLSTRPLEIAGRELAALMSQALPSMAA